ncbi:MAG: hypothetical protein JF564_00055, partial [Sphingomonas sp.]|nr:hypothetical protein [Sphingomonas sp.]
TADKAEGNGGESSFLFTVARTGDVSAASSATWSLSNNFSNPATASDFIGGVLPSGIVSFAAGEASKVIALSVAGDDDVEPDEYFSVNLASPTGAAIGTASAIGVIRNDEIGVPTTINGTAGSDILIAAKGGSHLSVMTGGAGADIFDFNSAGPSASYQEITDFVHGIDHIDLPFTLGAGAFLTFGSGSNYGDYTSARSSAQTLLDGHAGTTDIAAMRIGADLYLFYNSSGTGATINAVIKLDGLGITALSTSDFI